VEPHTQCGSYTAPQSRFSPLLLTLATPLCPRVLSEPEPLCRALCLVSAAAGRAGDPSGPGACLTCSFRRHAMQPPSCCLHCGFFLSSLPVTELQQGSTASCRVGRGGGGASCLSMAARDGFCGRRALPWVSQAMDACRAVSREVFQFLF